MDNYKYYISRYVNDSWEQETSLEDNFSGMKYVSCSGLSVKGKIKNIYTESYPESDSLRVYIPETIARENTDIELKFAFSGENRRDIYDQFCDFITGYKIRYWDTCRNRVLEMILIESIEPDEDFLYGSSPFVTAKFKFKNLKGQTEKKV